MPTLLVQLGVLWLEPRERFCGSRRYFCWCGATPRCLWGFKGDLPRACRVHPEKGKTWGLLRFFVFWQREHLSKACFHTQDALGGVNHNASHFFADGGDLRFGVQLNPRSIIFNQLHGRLIQCDSSFGIG
jgi:hypothetical protein